MSLHQRYMRRGNRPPSNTRVAGPSVPPLLPVSASQQLRYKFTLPELKDSGLPAAQISNCSLVASFNWLEGFGDSTILIPGAPPRWTPPIDVARLQEDSDIYYRDINAAHFPNFPSQPAIEVLLRDTDFDISKVDIFCCGNTMGCLLKFVSYDRHMFRFSMQKIGNTVFFVRKNNTSSTETIEGIYGYGHSFPEAYTTWDVNVAGSESHQRLVNYRFGDLNVLLHSESDGYLPDKLQDNFKLKSADSGISPENKMGDSELLISNLTVSSSSNIHGNGNSSTTTDKSPQLELPIREKGFRVPQEAVFDLKTRALTAKPHLNMDQFYSRLWVNQTPTLILAYHDKGMFTDIDIKDVTSEVKDWEARSAGELRMLLVLLNKLVDICSKAKDGSAFEVRRAPLGVLEVWIEVEGWSALPEDLVTRLSGSTAEEVIPYKLWTWEGDELGDHQ